MKQNNFNTPQELRLIAKENQAESNVFKLWKNLKARKYWRKQRAKYHKKFFKEYNKRNG